METKQDIQFMDKVIGALRKAVINLEEFQVKIALGKAEAEDNYEEVKKKFNLFIHNTEFKIKGVKEDIEELKEEKFQKLFKDEKKKFTVKDCQLDTDKEVLIPDDYVSNIEERLNLYKELNQYHNLPTMQAFYYIQHPWYKTQCNLCSNF